MKHLCDQANLDYEVREKLQDMVSTQNARIPAFFRLQQSESPQADSDFLDYEVLPAVEHYLTELVKAEK